MNFREMYDLPPLTEADKSSGPWESKGFALDGNQDGSFFIVENSKGGYDVQYQLCWSFNEKILL